MNVIEMLRKMGIDPKKSLGQNFMIQPGALVHMADASDIGPEDAVLEIGAGLGSLTDLLAARARRVVAVEIDQRFITHLRERYRADPHVEVVEADILQVDIDSLMGEDRFDYHVVANLPYYITTAIIKLLLERPTPPSCLVLTMQREVAKRITAKPDDMSLLAVSVQVYGQPKIVTQLKAGNFYPRPQVDSAILRISPFPDGPLIPFAEIEGFFRIVRAGFSQSRKQIKNSLSSKLQASPEQIIAWLTASDIDPRRRAETLTVHEWVRLAQCADSYIGLPGQQWSNG